MFKAITGFAVLFLTILSFTFVSADDSLLYGVWSKEAEAPYIGVEFHADGYFFLAISEEKYVTGSYLINNEVIILVGHEYFQKEVNPFQKSYTYKVESAKLTLDGQVYILHGDTKDLFVSAPVGCPGLDTKSNLYPKTSAIVAYFDGSVTNLRNKPSTSGVLISQMNEGTIVSVLEGPTCSDTYAWWMVKTMDGTEGWAAEGVEGKYFLLPMPVTVTSEPELTPDTQPEFTCEGAPTPRMILNGIGIVLLTKENPGIGVRAAAGDKVNAFRLNTDAIFSVIDGPTCLASSGFDHLVWWKIRSLDGKEGWVAEGSLDEYWISPFNTDATPTAVPTAAG